MEHSDYLQEETFFKFVIPPSSSMFWGFINNCTQFVRGGVGDEALQPLLSFFSFESVTSLLENVQGLLNVKDTTFLVFQLVTFLYTVCSFSRMSRTLLNTVGQQIEAREQGDKSVTQAAANPTATQVVAKPDSEAKTPAVAAVKKGKKHMDKTDRPVDDDSAEGSSMPPDTQSGVEPTDAQSEAEATDDTQSEAEPTDTKSEAQPTGTGSRVQPTSTRSEAQSTATRSGAQPTATRSGDTIESFSLHVGEESVSIAGVTGGSQDFTLVEADVSLNGNEWKRYPIVTGPEAPCILGIDFLRNGYFKDPKGFRWAFGIAAVETGGVKQLNTLPGLSEKPSAVGLLKVEEQQVPIATSTVHRRQYRTTRDAVIPIHKMIPECRPQFAFTWRGVQYTWNRLPQGWEHSPTICHGLIQAAMEKGETPEHLQYIDDNIVWANTAMEVFEKGEKIIQILLKAGFAIKKSKVKGPAREIQFLGVKWHDGRRQIPTKVINKITAMSPLTNKKETQAFLGAIGFWRMHIPEYSQIVSPLYLVTRKKNDFHWGPEQQQAFAQIKQEIAHAVALGPVRTGLDVKNVLYSAARNHGLSWSLWQKVPGETLG
ncbi:hypothetical protein DUI87_01965 [Hirundo rustica rustica]|uniref:ribonuclease H n=1 Tax=Hirundo rustica rustica TaxID=333673 RepID=A0A3M0L6W8_HIRRU|nr:hypothetical protein DUI87_01965 [Hirundo rustica rustica]